VTKVILSKQSNSDVQAQSTVRCNFSGQLDHMYVLGILFIQAIESF